MKNIDSSSLLNKIAYGENRKIVTNRCLVNVEYSSTNVGKGFPAILILESFKSYFILAFNYRRI